LGQRQRCGSARDERRVKRGKRIAQTGALRVGAQPAQAFH
jgi:hypothetical protein